MGSQLMNTRQMVIRPKIDRTEMINLYNSVLELLFCTPYTVQYSENTNATAFWSEIMTLSKNHKTKFLFISLKKEWIRAKHAT